MVSHLLTETSQLRRRQYSAQVCAQTLVHFLFPHSYKLMGPKSGRNLRGTGLKARTSKLRAVIKHSYCQKNIITLFGTTRESKPTPLDWQSHTLTARHPAQYNVDQ